MQPLIVLLRAVNVAGSGLVAMADLRAALAAEGFERVRTLLQSGNLVLETTSPAGPTLERRLEAILAVRLGLATTIFIRSLPEWQALVAENPFPAEARDDPSHLVNLATAEIGRAHV